MKNILFLFAFIFTSTLVHAQFPPTVQASNVQITYKTNAGATISWTRGSGSKCIAVVRKLSSSNSVPPASTTVNYTPNASYGSGSSLGNGDNYVVYEGTGTSVFVNSLSANTAYVAAVYEYNTMSIFTTTYYYNTTYATANYEYF